MKNIVVIGGGTGTSTILKGIKKYKSNITAIVSMADDGGGSGILRHDLGILPPGDLRNCMAALANTEGVMEKLLQYRFKSGGLKDQNFGNILIAALCDIYGGLDLALNEMENILSISGKVLPVTYENIHLVAEFENGDKCIGESIIPNMAYKLDTKIKKMGIFPDIPKANKDAVLAIKEADVIIFGPGSLYTSIIPNLLVDGIIDGLKASKAEKIYISNVMTELGETTDFKLRDHINAIYKHSYMGIIDSVVINTKKVSQAMLERYKNLSKSSQVEIDQDDYKFLEDNKIDIIEGDFIDECVSVRHNGEKIAKEFVKRSIL